MKSLAITCLIVLFWSQVALGDIAGEEEGSFYAVGRAEDPSQVAAENQACERAKRELIAYVFGLTTKVTGAAVQTLNELQLTQTIKVHSDWLFMKGLRQDVSLLKIEKQQYVMECKALYPKKEALAEKDRMLKARAVLEREKINKSTLQNADPVHFGRVMIKANAPKARVFFDGVFCGFTPLEIDRVSVGSHDLSVSAEGFVTDTRKVSIRTGDSLDVFVTLKRNQSTLKILGLPANATLWLNGMRQEGRSATLVPGEVIVRAEAPFYLPHQDVVKLAEGVDLEHRVTLNPRNVPASFVSKGEKATVYLDGAKIGETPLTTELSIGKHTADFIGSHGLIHSQTFDLKPSKGYAVTAPENRLKSTKDPRFSNIVLYKDTTLAVRKDYTSLNSVPSQDPNTKSIGFSVELVEPMEGYIFINGQLAGKKTVIVDAIVGDAPVIRFEAPGYHADEITITPYIRSEDLGPESPETVRTAYRGLNDYKVFLFKKRPVHDDIYATVVHRDQYKGGMNVVGFYRNYSLSSMRCNDNCPYMTSYRMADLPVSLGRIPALVLEVKDPGERREINGRVTEILFQGPPGVVQVGQLFYGARIKDSSVQNGANGYLAPRTLYFGDTDRFTYITRYTVRNGRCGQGWTTHACNVTTKGPPFETIKVDVDGPQSSEIVNAKRYSP